MLRSCLLVAAFLVLAGCGPTDPAKAAPTSAPVTSANPNQKPTLVGTWKRNDRNATYRFEDDGKYSFEIVGRLPNTNFTASDVVRGTYKLEGNKISMKMQAVFASSPDADEATQTFLRKKNEDNERKVKDKKEQVMTFAFDGPNSVTFSTLTQPPMPAFVLTRELVGN